MVKDDNGRFQNMLWSLGETPEDIRDFFVYSYHFIDDRLFFLNAREALGEFSDGYAIIEEAEKLLKRHGWEGDGTLELLWLPPFIGVGVEDTYGVVCFHVKQSNNGTSWFASNFELPFSSLERRQVSNLGFQKTHRVTFVYFSLSIIGWLWFVGPNDAWGFIPTILIWVLFFVIHAKDPRTDRVYYIEVVKPEERYEGD